VNDRMHVFPERNHYVGVALDREGLVWLGSSYEEVVEHLGHLIDLLWPYEDGAP
jgi:hypothetical protein